MWRGGGCRAHGREISAGVLGQRTPWATGHCVSPTLPAAQLNIAGAVTSKQNCSSSHTESHVPSDDYASNRSPQHKALCSQAQLSEGCPDFQTSSISAMTPVLGLEQMLQGNYPPPQKSQG